MTKLRNKTVEVRLAGGGLSAFLWRGKWHTVEKCEKIYQRRYASDPYYGLDTFRVKARDGGVYEMVVDGANWILERVWD